MHLYPPSFPDADSNKLIFKGDIFQDITEHVTLPHWLMQISKSEIYKKKKTKNLSLYRNKIIKSSIQKDRIKNTFF